MSGQSADSYDKFDTRNQDLRAWKTRLEFKILDGKDYYDDAIVKLKKQFDDLQLKNIELSTELRNSKKFELLKKSEEIRESSLEELYARQWGL